ncbi:nucleotidyltransferase domain-containing protein [Pseudomonas oryzihabitans]|uniref:nucleotidyltransferase domain-containing protein n=1 Tax=Pseudomonas oryzihabitans TaxID=47885 RepID=UPI0028956DC6|nr:amino acid transporter [Pseudomonas oryzihabitans]MDT3722430.1 amino acid transporter [Pseudomonas oryzihabitans]
MRDYKPLDSDRWNSWKPSELASRLSNVNHPWCIVGGWALDLWLGEQTRNHEDLEFTILRQDFWAFQQVLYDHELYVVHDGELTFLPPDQPPTPGVQQLWCLDTRDLSWRVDMMIEPGTSETWIYKRDHSIRASRTEMVFRDRDGIPYLRPAAILLFKAKHLRGKDVDDFNKVVPKLPGSERAWLRHYLTQLHPDHLWLKEL